MKIPVESNRTAALAAEYQKQGYRVIIAPGPELIPFDLGTYRADLLAEKANEHLLIEIKNRSMPVSIDRLQRITETVKQHADWRFLFVNTGPDSDDSLPQEPLSWQVIATRLDQAKRLREAGDAEAAILLFWAALEALLRRHAESVDLPIEQLSARALLNYLYSNADLSFEHFDQANKLLAGRNRLAHGFPIQEAPQQAAQLQGLIAELASDWLPLRSAA